MILRGKPLDRVAVSSGYRKSLGALAEAFKEPSPVDPRIAHRPQSRPEFAAAARDLVIERGYSLTTAADALGLTPAAVRELLAERVRR